MFYDYAKIKIVKKLIEFGEDVYLHYSEEYHSADSYCEKKAREAIRASLDGAKKIYDSSVKDEIYDWVCYELFG